MAEKNSNLLLTPSAKKHCRFKREYPFPIITNQCEENETDLSWKPAIGHIENNYVLVHDEESIKMLYCMGFFGKGTLSKHAPKICCQKTWEPKEIKPRSAISSQVDDAVDDMIDVVDSDDDSPKSKKLKTSNEDEVLTLNSSDSDDDNKKIILKQTDIEEEERLQLSFQEAFFLSYGLGCLVVKDKDKYLDVLSLWSKLCNLTPSNRFPVLYTAYHHFRSKGWIVKNGLKYGTDYVLYKDGPPFYHATYSVIVRLLKENLKDVKGNRELTWASLAALNRVNTTAGKGLLILYVIKPNTLTENDQTTPLCIGQFKLEEVLYKRWVASENRENDDK